MNSDFSDMLSSASQRRLAELQRRFTQLRSRTPSTSADVHAAVEATRRQRIAGHEAVRRLRAARAMSASTLPRCTVTAAPVPDEDGSTAGQQAWDRSTNCGSRLEPLGGRCSTINTVVGSLLGI